LAEAVEHRAFDPVLGVRLESNILPGVVFGGCVDQSNGACVHEIVNFNMYGKAGAEAQGNRFNKRKVIDHDLVPARLNV
jgi:hypothetical protein